MKSSKKRNFKYTVISGSVTLSLIITKTIEAIVGFIAISLFKPIWDKIVKWWKNERKIN
jgi:hypothetical protein